MAKRPQRRSKKTETSKAGALKAKIKDLQSPKNVKGGLGGAQQGGVAPSSDPGQQLNRY